MITKIILGDGTILDNVEEVQEIVQNEGDSILNGLTINLVKKDSIELDLSEIETIFGKENILGNIKVYNKDVISREIDELGNEVLTYSPEYISLDTGKYTGVRSIYKHISNGRVSIQLNSDPTKISDAKYNELLIENSNLQQQVTLQQSALDDLFMNVIPSLMV